MAATRVRFLWNGNVLPQGNGEGIRFDYGIVAAQQRSSGGVWLVVAGLSGPGTYAAVMALLDSSSSLPKPKSRRSATTTFAGIRAEFALHSGPVDGDARKVPKWTVLGDTFLSWDPRSRKVVGEKEDQEPRGDERMTRP
jgi:hypothetical protein